MDKPSVDAVRHVISFMNAQLGHTYRQIADQQQDISISAVKQFMARDDVKYRLDSNIVQSLKNYIIDHKDIIATQGNREVDYHLGLLDETRSKSTQHERAVVFTYSMIYRLLKVEPESLQFNDTMQRIKGTYVLEQTIDGEKLYSALLIQRKKLNETETEVWEFVHVSHLSNGPRRSDGIAAVKNSILYLGGDIAEGFGVELISASIGTNPSSRTFDGNLMSLNKSNLPYTSIIRILRVIGFKNSKLFEDLEQSVLENELNGFLESENVRTTIEASHRKHNQTAGKR